MVASRRAALAAAMVMASAAVPAGAAIRSGGDDAPVAPSGVTSVTPINGRGWRLSLTAPVLYDDNILHVGDRQVLPVNGHRADFRFSPSAAGSIGLPFGRQQLYLGGELGRDIYGRNTQLNRNRYLIGGGLNWRVGSSCTWFRSRANSGGGRACFRRCRWSTAPAFRLSRTTSRKRRPMAPTQIARRPVGLGFGGHVDRTQVNNLNPLRRPFNAKTTTFGPNVSYGSPGLGRFSLGGDVQIVRYPNRTVPVFDPSNAIAFVGDGVDIYSGRIGYQRNLGTRISIQLGGSYLKVKPKPGATVQALGIPPVPALVNRNGYSGGGYDASVSYTPSRRVSAQFTASRNITSSPNVGALFVVAQAYGADFSYEIGPSITTGLGGTYNIKDYRGSVPTLLDQQARISDKLGRVYAHLTYAPVRLYTIDFEVAHQVRNSNPDIYNYKSTSATLSLKLLFGRG